MANSWYTRVKGFLAGTKARGSDVRFEYDAVEDAFDLMPAPHSGGSNAGFSGAVEFEGAVSLSGGLGANASGADTYKLTNMIDGSADQDYATIANVAAEVAGGGTPGSIPITSLGVGTATSDQFIKINSGGTAPVGITKTDVVEWYYPQGYFSGLELNSYDLADKRRDMRLDVGECLDSDGDELLTVSASIEKQMDVAWVEGAGGGAGVVLPSSAGTGTYYFFLITKDTDGTVDWMGDTSSTGANVPSGWTVRRQIGSWPYLNVAGGSMGWTDGGARRQFGNRVMQGINHRGKSSLVTDSSITTSAESFDLSTLIDSSEKSVAKLQFTLRSTNTAIEGRVSYGYNSNPIAGLGASLITGIVASGDSDLAHMTEELYNDGTTFYYVGSTTLTNHTLYVGLLEYNNMREVNY